MLSFILFLLPVTSTFAADVDYCSVYVDGSTNKVTRQLKAILSEKKYTIVSKQEDAWNTVYSQREGCALPFGCGGSVYHIYFSTHLKSDPNYGTMITQDWQERKRADAVLEMESRLGNCPDAR